ncbi:LOW QUALITY PROTEIN: glutathione hydrolase 5 proenzyme [Dromiciops gliroides]|uniref:LOW QUALITY PROTEIN: glutathione hydrolase 5 proenzyme n=1 Tax=Dromiciops gliroides TaxID=33562 RepID=UPI001CC7D35C|nr:LOW QUALITY PROTEIN: glutathione hydrolase 5 proenzyme [Dromiciops gliroides]
MAKVGARTASFLLLALGILVAIIVSASILAPRRPCTKSYPTAAVAADAKNCSDIGRDILKSDGSPVDAAIAALICTSVINPQSMGLGGGVIFTIYNASTGEVEVINARETVPKTVPLSLQKRCETDKPLGKGAYWIGVPGELRGYQLAHQRHGRLPWAQLFEPTLRLLQEGIHVPKVLSLFLNSPLSQAINSSSLRQLFFNGKEPLAEGAALAWPALAQTLQIVAEKGADEFYEGSLAEDLLTDLAREGSALTKEDLASFQAQVVKPLALSLGDYTLYSPPPPAGGAILSFVLNVLQGFRFPQDALAQLEGKVSTYHQVVETLKFANGLKWKLRDPRSYPESPEVYRDLLTDDLAQKVRNLIGAQGNHTASYYNLSSTSVGGQEAGTSHVAVLGSDGSAVSATSTINTPFGSMVYSPQTGLILNNQLLDLCWRTTPGSSMLSDAVPGERPPSSTAPSILLSKDRKSELVIGGSGGQLILPATALAIMNNLWFGLDLHEAIKAKILHVLPNTKVLFEPGFDKEVKDGLINRGHKYQETPIWLNVVQAVARDRLGCIHAESDKRKLGGGSWLLEPGPDPPHTHLTSSSISESARMLSQRLGSERPAMGPLPHSLPSHQLSSDQWGSPRAAAAGGATVFLFSFSSLSLPDLVGVTFITTQYLCWFFKER